MNEYEIKRYLERYLVMPKAQIKSFIYQKDRDYFSKPVRVMISHIDIDTRLVYCLFPNGKIHPTTANKLKYSYQLSKRKLADARI